jgi:hypothetical protein
MPKGVADGQREVAMRLTRKEPKCRKKILERLLWDMRAPVSGTVLTNEKRSQGTGWCGSSMN